LAGAGRGLQTRWANNAMFAVQFDSEAGLKEELLQK